MKTHIKTLTIAALGLLYTALGHAQKFTISGKFPGLTNGAAVELETEMQGNTVTLVRTKVVNGAFKLVGQVKSPTVARLKINDKASYAENEEPREHSVNLVVENVPIIIDAVQYDSIPLDTDLEHPSAELEKHVRVKGGREQANYQKWRDMVRQAEINAWYSEQAWLNYAYEHPKATSEPATENSLKALARKDKVELKRLNREFVEAHPNTAIALKLQRESMTEVFVNTRAELEKLIERFKNNVDRQGYASFKLFVQSLMKYTKGKEAVDFVVFEPDGKQSKLLASLSKDKYNIVDFWASWCGPCRVAIPGIKALYEKWKEKINIVSVSLDRNDADWQKAMTEEAMPWKQVLVSPMSMRTLKDDYRILGIPELLVVTPDGKIIYATGEPADAHDFIEKLCTEEEK